MLRKWFDGEIVENGKAREALETQIKETAQKSGMTLSVSGIKAAVYEGFIKILPRVLCRAP